MKPALLLLALLLMAAPLAASTPQFTTAQILETWGWIIAHQQEITQCQLSSGETALFVRGATAAFQGAAAPCDQLKSHWEVEQIAKARRASYVRTVTEKNRAAGREFLAGLKTGHSLVVLADGLAYEVIRPGQGPAPKQQETVRIQYTARLIDGTEFFQFGPIDEVLWPSRFSPYLLEALQHASAGEKLMIYVPSPLGDQDNDKLGVPPGALMSFELELLGIRPSTPTELDLALALPAPLLPPPPPSGFSAAQLIECWGWITGRQTRIQELNLAPPEITALTLGLKEGIANQAAPADLPTIYPAVTEFARSNRQRVRLEFRQHQLDAKNALFTQLQSDPAVVALPSGLRYKVIKPGAGPGPKVGEIAKIYYVGRLLDGTVFDQRKHKEPPRPVPIRDRPVNWIVPGWNEGLQKINRGGTLRLWVPPELGYGDESHHLVPSQATLVYDIELVEIQAEVGQ